MGVCDLTRALRFLEDERVRLILVGGKGGVGKTTIAAALSLRLAEQFPGRRYLAVSAGPAHALARTFACPLDSAPRPVNGKASLYAAELDAARLFSDFKARYGQALRAILGRGTYLDDEDISAFLDLSFPGLDELMAMLQIIELLESGQYDSVIVDTAPTGHTLRLLSLPALTRAWVSVLDRMLEKHRFMSRVYTGRYRRDEADEFVEMLNRDLARLAAILRNRETCQFLPVTLLEPVVLAETERLLASLVAQGISPRAVVVNQVMPAPDGCPLCASASSRQRRCLASLASRHPELEFASFSVSLEEVRGEQRLRALASQAVPDAPPAPAPRLLARREPIEIAAPEPGLRFFLFCGKGGVGKTTLSCAFALQLSRLFPEKKVLLFSTDPAHSLSDCLAQEVGPEERRVDGTANLFAVEIDPEVLFGQWKQTYVREIEEVFDDFSQRVGVEIQFDRQVLAGLLDLTPPGLDELMTLAELAVLVEQGRYDYYVLDTAPAGHTLRFLELLTLVQDWLRTFFEILLKYGQVARLPKASEMLVETSRRIKRIRRILTNPARCEAIPVTVPATAALEESERLLAALDRIGIRYRSLLVNQLIARADGCAFCQTLAVQHRSQLGLYRETFPGLEIIPLPRWPTELRGTDALLSFLRLAPFAERHPADRATATAGEMAIGRAS
ncbi:MAG: ArsA family ATPase [Acidobacteriota bacterium]